MTEAGRDALASAELSGAGRQYVDTAMRRIDALSEEIDPLRRQLVNFARRQPGCVALQARHYGVGWLCAAIIWAEIGDVRRDEGRAATAAEQRILVAWSGGVQFRTSSTSANRGGRSIGAPST